MSRFARICIILFASLDSYVAAGPTWDVMSSPTPNLLYKLSFLDSLRGWAAGFNGTIIKTIDGGRSWEIQVSGLTNDIHDIAMLDDRFGWGLAFERFVDTLTWYGTRILKTTNGGTTWTNQPYPVTGEFFNSIVFQDSLRGWIAGGFGHMLQTADGGTTWLPVETDSTACRNWSLINVEFFTQRYGFAMGGNLDIVGVVWRTTDGGFHWTPSCVSPEPVHDMAMVDSLHLIGIVGDLDFGAGVVRSRNGGDSWQYTFLNIFGMPQAISFRTTNEAWAPLGFTGMMMFTTDTAHTWTAIETPGRKAMYDLVFTDSLTGFAVGDSGTILKYRPVTVHVEESSEQLPTAPALYQNFPNPFNPSTTIYYDVPVAGLVTLRVFNVLGQEIRTLVHQRKESGRHQVHFDANGLPGGVYFCRLTVGATAHVRKMIFLQ